MPEYSGIKSPLLLDAFKGAPPDREYLNLDEYYAVLDSIPPMHRFCQYQYAGLGLKHICAIKDGKPIVVILKAVQSGH